MNGWVNNREAGDLKRHRAHYGVIVMINLDVAILLNASRRPGFVCNWLKQLVYRYLCIHVRSSEVCHQTLVAYLLPTWTSAWITLWYHLYLISGYRLRNFEIRVGHDATDLGNNAICYNQTESMINAATVRFQCREELSGSWVSVNKSDSGSNNEYLQLMEVRVFDGKLWYHMYYISRTVQAFSWFTGFCCGFW